MSVPTILNVPYLVHGTAFVYNRTCVRPGDTLGAAIDDYRQTWREVDEIVLQATGLDERARISEPGSPGVNLRWILMHLLEETARHAGHADILRELLDGSTGR